MIPYALGTACLFFFAIFWRIARNFWRNHKHGWKRTLGLTLFVILAIDSVGSATICFWPVTEANIRLDLSLVAYLALPSYAIATAAYYLWPQKKDDK